MRKSQATWLPIVGNCQVVRGVIKYTPVLITEGENKGSPTVALMKSDQMFESGTITVRARINDPDGKVQIGLSNGHAVEIFAGLNIGSAAYGIATYSNNQWENFRTAAYGVAPPVGRDILIKVAVAGSQITMWVDGVEVVRGTYPVRRAQLTILLRGEKSAEAELLSVESAQNVAFVVMQFTNEFNSLTNGSNVAFVTFAPPNLSISRTLEADIDLYVSKDPTLTNLNASAILNSFKSTNEGGTEFIIFTNAVVSASEVYYIAVRSQDQQAAEFSLMGVSSDQPFQREQNGVIFLQGFPISQRIPDGSAKLPGGTVVLALGLDPRRIATVEASELIIHEDLGDLLGNLSHNRTFAVLNNHTRNEGFFSGTNLLIYNDTLTKTIPGTTNGYHMRTGPSDGPGTLNNFVGKPLIGPWFLTMVDNSPSLTGRVENLEIRLTALRDLKDGLAVGSVAGGQSVSFAVDIPVGATNMVVTLTQTNVTANITAGKFRARKR